MRKYKSFILYGFFGLATTLVNILVYWICANLFNFTTVISTCISWLIAVIFAYVTNKLWVFGSNKNKINEILKEFVSFFSCRILTGILDVIIMYIFVEKLKFSDMLIKTVSNVIVIILNYVASKLIIFNHEIKFNVNIKKCNWKEILIIIFILGLSILFSMNSPLNILQNGESATDSSVFRLFGMMMSKGYTPYLDMFDHKGPILYLINYLGFVINKINGIWLIEIVFLFFTFLFIYKTAKLKTSQLPAILVLLLTIIKLFDYFEGGNLVEEYALFFIVISLFIFTDYLVNNKISNIRIIICGACFMSVCLLRVNMIACWVVFCISILVKCVKAKEYKKILNYTLNFIIGSLIIATPIIFWLISKGALYSFIQNYSIFNIKYTTSLGLRAKFGTFIEFSNNIIILICLFTNIYSIFKNKNKSIYVVNLIYMILSLIMVSLSGRLYPHYGMILLPSFIIPLTYFINLAFENQNKGISIIVIIYIFSNIVIPPWLSLVHKTVTLPDNITSNNDISIKINKIIQDNSNEKDMITVYGNWDYLYLISNRIPASKYSYQFPIGNVKSAILDEYFNEIDKTKPKIIIIQKNIHNDDRIKKFIKNHRYKELLNEDNEVFVYKMSN